MRPDSFGPSKGGFEVVLQRRPTRRTEKEERDGMSLLITAVLRCDECGYYERCGIETRSTKAEWMVKSLVRDANKNQRWITIPKRYGRPTHLCANCADSAPPQRQKIQRKGRK
jgi:hypothetical protein